LANILYGVHSESDSHSGLQGYVYDLLWFFLMRGHLEGFDCSIYEEKSSNKIKSSQEHYPFNSTHAIQQHYYSQEVL
jgi:hypothetical protein